MRDCDVRAGELFSYVDLEARVRKDHPLQGIRQIVNEALVSLEREFAALYSPIGRALIAPEKLLRATLLQAFYWIRSERLLMERLKYDLLFRWFVEIADDPAWDHSVFSKNRDRLLEGDISAKFLGAILSQTKVKRLLSTDHFSVDGTPIEGWASIKSFRPRNGSGDRPSDGGGRTWKQAHGERHSNETHALKTDPIAMLYKKGKGTEAKLCFMEHEVMENRRCLVVDAHLTEASGYAERVAALHMIGPFTDETQAITLGADNATYDTNDFVKDLRSMKVTPHVAQNVNSRRSGFEGRTTRHPGDGVSRRIRKRIEEAFGWIKTVAGQGKTKLRGRDRVGWAFTFAAAAYTLVRLPKLMTETG